MFGAIQDEVNKIDNPDYASNNAASNLEEEYEKLYRAKVNLEDLDTNQENDELSEDDFDKLKDLVVSGNNLVDAYRNVIPVDILNKSRETIKQYEDELLKAIVNSDDVEEYRAEVDYIIANLITIYDGKEYKLPALKQMFDNKY